MVENIRFIKDIASHIERAYVVTGNVIYFPIGNENRAKAWCESGGVYIEIVNKRSGKIDGTAFPFGNYFSKKQCSPGAPLWNQSIKNGKWQFEGQYNHVLPTFSDYESIAVDIDCYLVLFEDD